MSFIFWSDVFAVVKAGDGETEVPAGSAAVHLGECKCDALCLQELLITLERNNSDFKSPWQHNFYLKAKLRKRGEAGGRGGCRGGWWGGCRRRREKTKRRRRGAAASSTTDERTTRICSVHPLTQYHHIYFIHLIEYIKEILQYSFIRLLEF